MATQEFEDVMAKHVGVGAAGIAPGLVVGAVNTSGKTYIKSFGTTTIDQTTPSKDDDVMWMASCSKLIAAVAVMQCVEKGLFTLDEPVARLLPELAEQQILTGFDADDKPVYQAPTTPITLRLLLSHRSGLAYDAMSPLLIKWRELRGEPPMWLCGEVEKAYIHPLLFDPGSSWHYSPGLDWAGRMIERATGLRLRDYYAENIFKPVGMTSTSFSLSARPDMKARKVPFTTKIVPDGPLTDEPHSFYVEYIEDAVDDLAGAGLYSTVPDYLKLLTSLLLDDGKLLRLPESTAELFRPQMADPTPYQQQVETEAGADIYAVGFPYGAYKFNHALGASVCTSGVDGYVGAGTMHWGGLPNLAWNIDRKNGTACIMGMQVVPPSEPLNNHVLKEAFYRMVWKDLGKGLV